MKKSGELNEGVYNVPVVLRNFDSPDLLSMGNDCLLHKAKLIVDKDKNTSRVVMRLHPYLAPYKAAVLPLSKQLSSVSDPIFEKLIKDFQIIIFENPSSLW